MRAQEFGPISTVSVLITPGNGSLSSLTNRTTYSPPALLSHPLYVPRYPSVKTPLAVLLTYVLCGPTFNRTPNLKLQNVMEYDTETVRLVVHIIPNPRTITVVYRSLRSPVVSLFTLVTIF